MKKFAVAMVLVSSMMFAAAGDMFLTGSFSGGMQGGGVRYTLNDNMSVDLTGTAFGSTFGYTAAVNYGDFCMGTTGDDTKNFLKSLYLGWGKELAINKEVSVGLSLPLVTYQESTPLGLLGSWSAYLVLAL